MEDGPAVRRRRRPQAAAMGLDDRVADRKAYAHAPGFGCHEGLEKPFLDLLRESRSGIANGDFDRIFVIKRGLDGEVAFLRRRHRLDAVAHQVHDDLLDLNLIDVDRR